MDVHNLGKWKMLLHDSQGKQDLLLTREKAFLAMLYYYIIFAYIFNESITYI